MYKLNKHTMCNRFNVKQNNTVACPTFTTPAMLDFEFRVDNPFFLENFFFFFLFQLEPQEPWVNINQVLYSRWHLIRKFVTQTIRKPLQCCFKQCLSLWRNLKMQYLLELGKCLSPPALVDDIIAFGVINVERNAAESHLAAAEKCMVTEVIRLSIIIHQVSGKTQVLD